MAKRLMVLALYGLVISVSPSDVSAEEKRLPVPDKLVVLTFDDGNKSDLTFVAPLLKRYGFGATFFITEGLGFLKNKYKKAFLTWDEVRKLHEAGFEIGNHTRSHPNLARISKERVLAEIEHIEKRCKARGIPAPTTVCYPGWHHSPDAVEVVRKKGYLFGRRGSSPELPDEQSRGLIYDPADDHPLLVPAAGSSGPNWGWKEFLHAVGQARGGKVCVLAFHGVPATLHPWVNTKPADFERYMKHLHDEKYTVIAMRDLAKYVAPAKRAGDPYASIERRMGLTPAELRCEYAVNPLGVNTTKPRFSWILKSYQRGQTQSAYQILVAGSAEQLAKNVGDKWDSRRVASAKSVNVVYRGKKLSSGEKCWWKVRVWPALSAVEGDKDGKTLGWSKPATFEMGLLDKSDWKGKWIGAGKKTPSPLFRKEFKTTGKIKSARAYFSGLGWGELYINGKKVSDEVLSPAFTDYFKEIKYRTHDVTDLLKEGPNAIGIMLGNGWFSTPRVLPPWGRSHPWSLQPKAILQITVTYDDRTRQEFSTDDSWKASAGPIGHNYVKLGERYDARDEQPLWNTAGFDDSKWKRAAVVSSPGGRLTCQIMPGMKVQNTISPTRLTNPKEGVWVFEFDRHFAGWVRLNVKGRAGAKIQLAYASRILENGLVDKRLWPGAAQTDVYTLKGDPNGEVYEPRFTFHPVQYVQVTGLAERPTVKTLTGCEVYSDVDLYGEFTCSNELFNRINENIERTLKIALKGLILDCLHREPIAYNEPASVSASLWTRKFMPNLWTKSARDIQYSSRDNGCTSDIVPVLPGMRRPPDAAMGVNYPMLVWYLHQCYADRRLLEQHYPTVKAWVDFLATLADDKHIVRKGWLGDHMLPGDAPGREQFRSKETPPPFIWTCFYYQNARTVAKMARVLGKDADMRRYARLAEDIRKVINETWLDRRTGHYASRSQTSNVLPLAIGIVPAEYKKKLIENIANTITEVDGGKLRVGHVGLPGTIESLVDNGLGETLYKVVNHTKYPGWGYMLSQGATTIWERWGRKKTNGADSMTMLAGVCRFFYNDIAGIGEPDFYGPQQSAPGYSQIAIKPHVFGDLTGASASIKTVRGVISSSWKKSDDSLTLDVVLPAGAQATVSVPTMGFKNVKITESGRTVWKAGKLVRTVSGITAAEPSDSHVTFEVGSGAYFFRLIGQ